MLKLLYMRLFRRKMLFQKIDFIRQFQLEAFAHTNEQFSIIIQNQKQIMGTLKDVQDQLGALQQSVQAEDTVIDSAVTLINGFSGIISGLQQQLKDALAANDADALQAVADSMTQVKSDIDAKAQTLATAVTANTPAQTTAGGSSSTTDGGSSDDSGSTDTTTDQAQV